MTVQEVGNKESKCREGSPFKRLETRRDEEGVYLRSKEQGAKDRESRQSASQGGKEGRRGQRMVCLQDWKQGGSSGGTADCNWKFAFKFLHSSDVQKLDANNSKLPVHN